MNILKINYNYMKEQILKELKGNYGWSGFETLGDIQNELIDDIISATREETIREIIGMCVNFDDYNNDQIISKEMLEELLNKLKK